MATNQRQGGKPQAGWWVNPAAFGLLALLAILPFASAFPNSFALDDVPIIVENALIKSLAKLPTLLTAGYWAGFFGPHFGGDLYRPLVLASFALNYAVGGLNPFGYHLVNLLLHLAVCWALYVLARQLDLSWGGALVASGLFAVHPLHTEAVTGIVGRAELLMTLGVLLAVVWYRRGGGPDRLEPRFAVASWGAFVLALLSKEQAIMLPALLALSDLIGVTGRQGRGKWSEISRDVWRRYIGYLLLVVAYLLLRVTVLRIPFFEGPKGITFLNNPLAYVSWDVRLLTALEVAGKYLWLFIWPLRLSADYSYNAIPLATSIWETAVLLAGVTWIGLLMLGIYAYVRGVRSVCFGVGCTILMFLPVSNLFIPIGTIMGERLFYLPSVGLCLVGGAGWDRLVTWARSAGLYRQLRPVSVGVLALALLLLSTRTILRNQDWRSTETLFQSTAQVVPQSAKVYAVRGDSLLDAGRFDEAIEALERAVRIEPNYERAYLTLGIAYAMKGRWDEAEAAFRRGLTSAETTQGPEHPLVADGLNKLAVLYVMQGQAAEPPLSTAKYAQAEPLYQRALAILEKDLGMDPLALAQPLENYAGLLRLTNRTTEASEMEARAHAIRAKQEQASLTR